MKKWKAILWPLLLVLVLAGAYLLYNAMKDQVPAGALMTVETSEQTVPPAEETTLPPETEESKQAQEAETTEETRDMSAPDFTVYDNGKNAVSLADLRGKPVIINFWATWCGYCVAEMPEFQTAFDIYGDRIHFMMINVTDGYQETRENAQSFIAEAGYTFPVYYDLELSAAYAYGVNAMPVTFFIDENGDFVAWGQGALNSAAIQQGVDMLLKTEEQP